MKDFAFVFFFLENRLLLAPLERNGFGTIGALLDQRFVVLFAGHRVARRPASVAVVLQTVHVGAEVLRWLAHAAEALAQVAHLVLEHVWLNLSLTCNNNNNEIRVKSCAIILKLYL